MEAISDALIDKGRQLLDWNDKVLQLLNRVQSLKKWNPSQTWPDFSIETLLATNKEWITPYLSGIKKPNELKKIDLKQILFYSLTSENQADLEKLAPQKVKIPLTGTFAKLAYQENNSAPVLSMPLQRCFGMLETPKVNGGKMNVLMHLLSPGYKIVQITNDLESFWKSAYFEVRKELRSKYKRHNWPEDPMDYTPPS